VIDVNTTFREAAAQRGVESVPLAHLSIELGHLYAEDFGADDGHLDRYFARIAPWVRMVRADCAAQLPAGVRPRVSTCFLIDDYFNKFGEPAKVIGALLETAARHEMAIDYIARESACSVADGLPLAQLVLDRIVTDPSVNTTGARPPAVTSGWLCNGERTPASTVPAAMKGAPPWSPPVENGPNQHSIFMDVQLFSEAGDVRTWSCSFLASVWQLIRLGLLRHTRAAPIRPRMLGADAPVPAEWSELPPVTQCNPAAAPFSAYRTMSVLQREFISVESAVSMILSQVSVDVEVLDQIAERSKHEGIDLPGELTARIGYALLGR
jgi:hypothetical protein